MEWYTGKKKLNSKILASIENKDCSPQSSEELKGVTKEIYDFMSKSFRTNKLIVDNFDCEQLFKQIGILNSNILNNYNQIIRKIECANVFNHVEPDDEKYINKVVKENFLPYESADEKFRLEDEETIRNFQNEETSSEENDEMIDENDKVADENNEIADENFETLDENCQRKTAFELEQERIKKVISNYEEILSKKQDWLLTGEVSAYNRPKDSLYNQDTDFDVNAKPVLIEDKILNEKIEKAIKTIIKNKAFSDGQRKVKPDDITSYKKDIQLEQIKSKKSLAAIYEEEYLKKKYGELKEDNPKHVEIKKMMNSVLPELQALFNHIPKAALPDIKIVSNLPAITVEEVAPTSISDMALLAPEEVKKKCGLLKGESERSATDRKRERRQKKILQRKKFKGMQINNKNPMKHRNTKIAEMGTKIKSSKDFFNRLQEYTLLQNKEVKCNKIFCK